MFKIPNISNLQIMNDISMYIETTKQSIVTQIKIYNYVLFKRVTILHYYYSSERTPCIHMIFKDFLRNYNNYCMVKKQPN